MRRHRRKTMTWMCCLNMVIFLVSGLLAAIAEPYSSESYVFLLSSTFSVASLMIFVFVLFRIEYRENGVCYTWAGLAYYRIPYDKVKEMDICQALDGHLYPILDMNKNPLAALKHNCNAPRLLRANSSIQSWRILRREELETLIIYSSLPVYVTEKMYGPYHKMLQEVFRNCPDRLLIACGGRYTKFVNMTEYNPGEYAAWQ